MVPSSLGRAVRAALLLAILAATLVLGARPPSGAAQAVVPPLARIANIAGPLGGVAGADGRAYVAIGRRLMVLDLADPSRPRELGRLDTTRQALNVVRTTDRVFLLSRGPALDTVTVQVVDVADPAQPRALGTVDVPTRGTGAVADGTTLYLAGGALGLRIVGAADPARPAEVAATAGSAADVAVRAGRAYVAQTDQTTDASGRPSVTGRLRVLDVSDPAAPREVGASAAAPGGAFRVALAGRYAYLDTGSGRRVLDVSDPAAPRDVATAALPTGRILVVGTRGYLAASDLGLRVLDLSDPAAPREVGAVAIAGEPYRAVQAGGLLLVETVREGMRLLSLADPAAPRELGAYGTPQEVGGLIARPPYLYALGRRGLRILEIGDLAPAHEIGAAATPPYGDVYFGVAMALTDRYAFVGTGEGTDSTLDVFDVADPAHPALVASLGLGANVATSMLDDRYLYVGHAGGFRGDGGIQVVDVADPLHPFSVGFLRSGTSETGAWGLRVVGTTAYAATGYGGLQIVDLSDPANPREAGRYTAAGWTASLDAEGTSVYLGGMDGLRVLDVADPGRVRELDFVTQAGPFGVVRTGCYAYLPGPNGLPVVDLCAAGGPREIARYPDATGSLAVDGPRLYNVTSQDGVVVLRSFIATTRAVLPLVPRRGGAH